MNGVDLQIRTTDSPRKDWAALIPGLVDRRVRLSSSSSSPICGSAEFDQAVQYIVFKQYTVYSAAMKATLLIKERETDDAFVIERVVWLVPAPVPGSVHRFKYRLYCGLAGRTLVRYDNEAGKGDHKHLGADEREEPYAFSTLERLLTDFAADVRRLAYGQED